jgi:hypothetical protein
MKPNELSLTKAQIREFLNRLAGNEGCQFSVMEWRCGGPEFIYAKKILTLMNIPAPEQEKFLEMFKEYGGYCDCEILMNAAPRLLGEETPW